MKLPATLHRILARQERITRFAATTGAPVIAYCDGWRMARLADFQAALMMWLGGELYDALHFQFCFYNGIPYASSGLSHVRLGISLASAHIATRGRWFLSDGQTWRYCGHEHLYQTVISLLREAATKERLVLW